MPISMADQFRGLPMGDLIGGPLMAACDAQVRLANATATFIQQVGFMPKDAASAQKLSEPGQAYDPSLFEVRTVAFRFDRPSGTQSATPDANGNSAIPTERVELDVPLLAIVKVPALSIDTVDIVFDMEVKNSESSKESTDMSAKMSADASVGWGPFSLKVHIEGSVASHKENTRQTDQTAKYHVEVHAADKGMPEGLARVLDIMNTAIAPKTITQKAAAQPGSAPVLPPSARSASAARAPDAAIASRLDHEGKAADAGVDRRPDRPVEVLRAGQLYTVAESDAAGQER